MHLYIYTCMYVHIRVHICSLYVYVILGREQIIVMVDSYCNIKPEAHYSVFLCVVVCSRKRNANKHTIGGRR